MQDCGPPNTGAVVESVAGLFYTSKNRKVANWPESGVDGSDVDHISLN